MRFTASEPTGTQSERRGQLVQELDGDGAQRRQHRIDCEAGLKTGQRHRARGEQLGQQTAQGGQCLMCRTHPAPGPAQRAGQLDVGTQAIGGRFQTSGPLHRTHHRLHLNQRTGQPRRQTIGQQAERFVRFAAVPASDQGPERRLAPVGAVAGEAAASPRMPGAARESCLTPPLTANVGLAGVPRVESKLHRPWARTAADRGGPSLFWLWIGAARL